METHSLAGNLTELFSQFDHKAILHALLNCLSCPDKTPCALCGTQLEHENNSPIPWTTRHSKITQSARHSQRYHAASLFYAPLNSSKYYCWLARQAVETASQKRQINDAAIEFSDNNLFKSPFGPTRHFDSVLNNVSWKSGPWLRIRNVLWFLGDDEELVEEGILPIGLNFCRQYLPPTLRSPQYLYLDDATTYWSEIQIGRHTYSASHDLLLPVTLCGVPVISHFPPIQLAGTQFGELFNQPRNAREIRPLLDNDVIELLSLVPGAQGICHWADGVIQVVAPDISDDQLRHVQLPMIQGFNVSITRWAPDLCADPMLSSASDDSAAHKEASFFTTATCASTKMVQPNLTFPPVGGSTPNVAKFVPTNPDISMQMTGSSSTECSIESTADAKVASQPQNSKLREACRSTETNSKDIPYVPDLKRCARDVLCVLGESEDQDESTPNGMIPQPQQVSSFTSSTSERSELPPNVTPPVPITSIPPSNPPGPVSVNLPTLESSSQLLLNSQSKVIIGESLSRPGLKVREKESGEMFLTVSTHAAYDGINRKPIKVLSEKSSPIKQLWKRARRKRSETWIGLSDQEVVDAETNKLIGRISRTVDGFATNHRPTFSDILAHNIALVRPDNPNLIIEREAPLDWCHGDLFDGPVQLIPEVATGKTGDSFVIGGYRTLSLSGREGSCSLTPEVRDDILLFRRICGPLSIEDAGAMRGAPLATRESEEDRHYTKIVGFMAFQFSPPPHAPERRYDRPADLHNNVWRGRATVCGAVKPSMDFKLAYEVIY